MLSGKLLDTGHFIDRKCDGPIMPAGDEESAGTAIGRVAGRVEAQQLRQRYTHDEFTMDIRKSQDRTADSVRQPVNRPRGGDFDTQHGADRKPLRANPENSNRAGRRRGGLQRLGMKLRPEARVFHRHGFIEQGAGARTIDCTVAAMNVLSQFGAGVVSVDTDLVPAVVHPRML